MRRVLPLVSASPFWLRTAAAVPPALRLCLLRARYLSDARCALLAVLSPPCFALPLVQPLLTSSLFALPRRTSSTAFRNAPAAPPPSELRAVSSLLLLLVRLRRGDVRRTRSSVVGAFLVRFWRRVGRSPIVRRRSWYVLRRSLSLSPSRARTVPRLRPCAGRLSRLCRGYGGLWVVLSAMLRIALDRRRGWSTFSPVLLSPSPDGSSRDCRSPFAVRSACPSWCSLCTAALA